MRLFIALLCLLLSAPVQARHKRPPRPKTHPGIGSGVLVRVYRFSPVVIRADRKFAGTRDRCHRYGPNLEGRSVTICGGRIVQPGR